MMVRLMIMSMSPFPPPEGARESLGSSIVGGSLRGLGRKTTVMRKTFFFGGGIYIMLAFLSWDKIHILFERSEEEEKKKKLKFSKENKYFFSWGTSCPLHFNQFKICI